MRHRPGPHRGDAVERGLRLRPGKANDLKHPDGSFDAALFANVFEHVLPERRVASLRRWVRVLRPGGVIVGQIPNPYFLDRVAQPPAASWAGCPMRVQKRYWRLAPVPWGHDFFVVTMKQLRSTASDAGFRTVYVRNFNYPPEVIPSSVRCAARALERPMRRLPWAWQFVLRRPG